jgi:quinol monooxygenase YgiN
MLAIIARMEINPDHQQAYLDAANAILAPTRAEPGCLLYAFSVDAAEAGVIWISEQWASEEDLMNHLRTAHVRGLIEVAGGLDIRSLDARRFEVSAVGPVNMPED